MSGTALACVLVSWLAIATTSTTTESPEPAIETSSETKPSAPEIKISAPAKPAPKVEPPPKGTVIAIGDIRFVIPTVLLVRSDGVYWPVVGEGGGVGVSGVATGGLPAGHAPLAGQLAVSLDW
jgi:hypothetical protein